MTHYFINDPNVKHNRKFITFRFLGVDYQLLSDKGVFSKDHVDTGTKIMLDVIQKRGTSGRFLDYGCGYGVVAMMIKANYPEVEVVASDVNERAIALTLENGQRYQLNLNVILSDGFSKIDMMFDTIAFNPPIKVGKEKMYDLLKQTYNHLKDDGILYVVIRKDQGAPSALRYLQTIYPKAQMIHREKGFWIITCEKT